MIDRDFVRGFVKLYALSLAADGEVYGLKILEEMNKHRFSLSPGPAARRGRHRAPAHGRRKIRKCYRLTARGRQELKEAKECLRTLVRVVFR